MKIDNQNVRNSTKCPLCEGPKLVGLVTCWPCFRAFGLRYGNQEAEEKIEKANNEGREV